METMPFYLVIIQSFPETLILIYLGLALTGLKADWKRIMLVAFLTALASYLIRTSALPAGMNIIVQLPILVLLLSILGRLSFSKATVACVLGLILLSFFEIIFNALMTAVTGVSVWQVTDEPWLRIIFPIPEFISLTLIAVLINKYRGRLIAWHKERYTHLSPMIWKGEVGLLLLFIIGMIAFGFYYETNLSQFQHPYAMFMSNTMYFIIFSVITLSLLLVQKLVFVQKQSRLMQAQRLHIDNLQDMMQVIKGQRHDFINHIQVVYGFLNLNEIDQALDYIRKLYRDVQISGDIMHLGVPELSALLLVKTGAAAGKGISLNIDIEANLSAIRVSPLDLVAVIGNLINNAMEAVEDMEPTDREVKLHLFTELEFCIIQVHNSGTIPEEVYDRLFEPGFSTKSDSGERGIGLASVKYLVEKYKGKIVVSSNPDSGTCFTVYYPKLKESRKRA
jgi:two-component system sensor histidine kinase AgrC